MTKDDPFRPRRRGGRRKGERRYRCYRTDQLLQLFACNDVPELRAKLRSMGIDAYYLDVKNYVEVGDYKLPEDLRAKAEAMFPDPRAD